MINVVHLSRRLCLGGTETVFVNWYKNIDRSKIHFDFIVTNLEKAYYKEILENMGSEIFYIEEKNGFVGKLKYLYCLYKYLKKNKNNIDIFQCHDHLWSGFDCMSAYFAGIKKRYVMSHFGGTNLKKENKIKQIIRRIFIICFATKKMACSKQAGLFAYANDNFVTINNGIDIDKFKFNKEIRNEIRKELNIENKFVIGHIGRFSPEKNHEFIIDIFSEVYKRNEKAILLLIGDGPSKKEIERKVNKLNLSNSVIFTGTKSNVNDYYQAMDAFVLPSLHEGLPLVIIEAQCSGLNCFISNGISDEAMICNITKIPLSKSIKEWADIILEKAKIFKRKDCSELVKNKGFDIKDTIKQIEQLYLEGIYD